MATYLVTGGCGFIGSHLCDALVAAGHQVRVLDNLSSGFIENIPAQAELIQADIRDRAEVLSAVDQVDGCFHLAAIASVEQSVQDWPGTHAVNLTGFVNVLDALTTGQSRRVPIVYASSAAVYGDNACLPLAENNQLRPMTAYGADKLGCELHARVASQMYGLPSVGLRFFNVYGPRQNASSPYSGVITKFISSLLKGTPITIFGDGDQTRDFIYVGDVVNCLIAAMDWQPEAPAVLNVCTGRATSVNHLASSLLSMVSEPVPILKQARRPGDIQHSVGDAGALLRSLKVRAQTEFGRGLRTTLEYFIRDQAPASARLLLNTGPETRNVA